MLIDLESHDYMNIIKNYHLAKENYTDRNIEKIFIDTYLFELIEKYKIFPKKPLWIGWKVTPKCNLNCIHCWAITKGEERNTEDMLKVIDKFHKMQVIHVTLSGGEPFLRKDIFEILKYLKKKRIYIEIFTNGILLNEEKIEKLNKILDKNTDTIQISLDAATETTFFYQRRTKKFNIVVDNINLLKKHNFIVRTNFTATHINVNEIFDAYVLANKLGVDTFSVSHVYELNRGVNLYDKVKLNRFINEIKKCLRYREVARTKLRLFLPIEFYSEIAQKIESKNKNSVIIDKESLGKWFIKANGDIYPEVTLEFNELKFGNIYNDSIDVILKKAYAVTKNLYLRNLEKQKCSYCNMLSFCQGGEIGRVYKKYKSSNYPDPKCTFQEVKND